MAYISHQEEIQMIWLVGGYFIISVYMAKFIALAFHRALSNTALELTITLLGPKNVKSIEFRYNTYKWLKEHNCIAFVLYMAFWPLLIVLIACYAIYEVLFVYNK